MKIGILEVGKVESYILEHIRESIAKAFPKAESKILKDAAGLPHEAYDDKRKQYQSSLLLLAIREHIKKTNADKILGITHGDLYVSNLSFVFGEAESPGDAAIISLHRLGPELYGNSPDKTLFLERAAKEAVHEVGHTFGLQHCPNPLCVMVFSNSVKGVDVKKLEFCDVCSQRLLRIVR